MNPFRVRVRQLVFGYYAVESKQWPWSMWREDSAFHNRTLDRSEAIRRAKALMDAEVISHKQIMETA